MYIHLTFRVNTYQFPITLPLHSSDCFQVYDLNGDGYISAEEMLYLLKDCINEQPTEEDPDEGIRDLVEITISNMVRRWLMHFSAV